MARPLEVLADLQLAVDGEPIDVRGTGDHIVIDLPSLQAGRRLLTSGPLASHRARTTHRIHEALESVGLSAEVRLQGDSIARVGAGARPGTFGRLLGLKGVEVRPAPPLRSTIRRRPLVTAAVIFGLTTVIAWWLLRDRSA